MTVNGETLNEFTHNSLQEPTHLAVDSKKNRIIVADGISSSILVFNIIGELMLKVSATRIEV
jgi:DNA-binding beta-propeller fold protein YncE